MRPEVQALPGPLPALTSRNAGRLIRSQMGSAGAGSRTLTWLPLLVMVSCAALLSVDNYGSSIESDDGGHRVYGGEWSLRPEQARLGLFDDGSPDRLGPRHAGWPDGGDR